VNHEGTGAQSGYDVTAGDAPAVTLSLPNPLTGKSFLPAEPETISRAPADIRSLSLAVLAGIGIVLFLRFAQNGFVPRSPSAC
jgi:hypothetical protein